MIKELNYRFFASGLFALWATLEVAIGDTPTVALLAHPICSLAYGRDFQSEPLKTLTPGKLMVILWRYGFSPPIPTSRTTISRQVIVCSLRKCTMLTASDPDISLAGLVIYLAIIVPIAMNTSGFGDKAISLGSPRAASAVAAAFMTSMASQMIAWRLQEWAVLGANNYNSFLVAGFVVYLAIVIVFTMHSPGLFYKLICCRSSGHNKNTPSALIAYRCHANRQRQRGTKSMIPLGL